MAATVLGCTIADTSNVPTFTTPSLTPAVGDLLVTFVSGRAQTTTPTVSASANGVTTFSLAISVLQDAGASRLSIHVADALTTGTTAMTLSVAYGSTTTACVGAVLRVSGMTKAGLLAILQVAGADNNLTSGGTPAVTFGAAPLTANTVLGFAGNNTNPATITPPTGFTEQADTGQATPTCGAEVVSKDTGFTSTTLTWGGTTGSRGAQVAIELDTSSGSTTYAVTGIVAGVSAVAGTVSTIEQVTGAVAGVSAVAGAVTVISGGGGSPYAVTGTVAGVSGVALSARLIAKVTGTVAAISAVHGAVAIPGPPLVRDNVKVEISTLPAYSGSDSPTDVSDQVNMPDGQSFTRGRADEFSTVEPGEAGLTLDYLTAPAIPSSAWVQVTEAAPDGSGLTRVFRGKVDTQDLTWDPLGKVAKLELGLVDRLALLQRHDLRSMLEEEILLDGPVAYYPLGEAEGSSAASDETGASVPPMLVTGSGLPLSFGTGIGPVDGLSAVQIDNGDDLGDGQYLLATDTDGFVLGSPVTLEAFLSASDPSAQIVVQLTRNDGVEDLVLILFQGSVVNPFTAVGSVAPGPGDASTTHLVATIDGTGHGVLYVNGVSVFTTTGASFGATETRIMVNGTGTVSHVAVYDQALSAARVAAHAAGLVGFAGDTTAARAARLAAYAGVAAVDTSFAGAHLMAAQATSGSDVLSALREVAVVENSEVYVDGSGVLTMPDGSHRTLAATTGAPAVTLLLSQLENDLKIALKDKQYLENQVTGTRDGGPLQLLQDDASIDDNDVYPKDLGTISAVDDDTVLALVAQELWGHQLPADRVSTLTVDLLTLANDPANYALVIALVGLELGDRIQVTGMWATAPFTVADAIVEGIGRNRDEDSWTVTFNVSPAAIYQRVILDDPVFCLDAGYYYGY